MGKRIEPKMDGSEVAGSDASEFGSSASEIGNKAPNSSPQPQKRAPTLDFAPLRNAKHPLNRNEPVSLGSEQGINPGEWRAAAAAPTRKRRRLVRAALLLLLALPVALVLIALGVLAAGSHFADALRAGVTDARVATKEETLRGYEFAAFQTADGFGIRYMVAEPLRTIATVVLLPGRSDAIETYSQSINYLVERGIAVFAMDWRGQGGSSREFTASTRGHIDSFHTYQSDLAQFMSEVVTPRARTDLTLMSHSTGGAVGIIYLLDHPRAFRSAVFISPMWDLEGGDMIDTTIKYALPLVDLAGSRLLSATAVAEYDEYQPDFQDNALTRNPFGFGSRQRQFEDNSALKTGAPTIGWIVAARENAAEIAGRLQASRVELPIMVFVGDDDIVIDTNKVADYTRSFARGSLNRFPGAKHHLLLEVEQVFNILMNKMVEFLLANMPPPRPKVRGRATTLVSDL